VKIDTLETTRTSLEQKVRSMSAVTFKRVSIRRLTNMCGLNIILIIQVSTYSREQRTTQGNDKTNSR
jgi:hypothetical protein